MTANPNQSLTANPNQSLTANPNQSLTANPNQSLTANPNQYGVYPPIYEPGRLNFLDFDALRGPLCWNDHRNELMDELKYFIDKIKKKLGIRAVWIGGSFLTKKSLPGDIDVTLILDGDRVDQILAGTEGLRKLATPDGLRGLADKMGCRIDPFIIVWKPGLMTATADTNEYYATRGYWDDWWQRQRQGEKDDKPDMSWTLPRQGYVEVIVNGYE